MDLREYWEPFNSEGKSVDTFVCIPEKAKEDAPAIVLIMEIWGVDEHILDLARRYAESGYKVIAPDLYSKGGKDPARSPGRITELKEFLNKAPMKVIQDPEERKKFVEREEPEKAKRLLETMDSIFRSRDMGDMVRTLNDSVSYVKSRLGSTSIGTVGYCMGGALSFMLSMNSKVNASVVFYGTSPDRENLKNVSAPVLGLYGGEDHRISDEIPEVADTMRSLKKSFEFKIYEGAQHAFFNDTRASYGYDAARDAWGRTLEFFRSTLR